MSTQSLDLNLLRKVRTILQDPAYTDSERAQQRIGELLVRYLKGELKYLPVLADLEEEFPPQESW